MVGAVSPSLPQHPGEPHFMKGGGGVGLCHQGETFLCRVAGEGERWEVFSRKRGFQLMCSLAHPGLALSTDENCLTS